MRDHDDRLSALAEFEDEIHDLESGLAVEVPGRLIRKEDFRIIDECSCDCDPLLLSSGELSGAGKELLFQSHFLEEHDRSCDPLLPRYSGIDSWQGDIFDAIELREEVELLEDEADPPIPDIRESLVILYGREIISFEDVRSMSQRVQEPDDIEQCGLPASGFPHDRNELIILDGEVDSLENRNFHPVLKVVGFLEVLHLYDIFTLVHGFQYKELLVWFSIYSRRCVEEESISRHRPDPVMLRYGPERFRRRLR